MRLTLIRPSDMHVHFRDGAMLRNVVPETARQFARAVVMPNVPSIETGADALRYAETIRAAAAGLPFTPLMTIKLTHRTTPETIRAAQGAVVAAKLYPAGATTASHDGISDPEDPGLLAVFEAMQETGMILCIHGEAPDAFILDREATYLNVVRKIVGRFPGLKVVLEHITTAAAVDYVENEAPANVAASITLHHLTTTLDDVLGRGGIRPHYFCYPVPKRPEDRRALLRAATGPGTGRFFFGSDTAPHLRGAKESACGCAGVYSAPVLLPVLLDVFLRACRGADETGSPAHDQAIRRLLCFASIDGPNFYGLPIDESDTISLVDETWTVPEEMGGVVPFMAGETIPWKVLD
ncbi:dihydroorotase (plasmid) [Tundrisphaera sp. TA3]|uniref:dihydroorotase n=1 Tax=Tundrisphaera sp. TA3 TaxID=3435775 RepID=UPI003EBA07F6